MIDQAAQNVLACSARVQLLVIGVDGVLTDAGMYFSEDGDIIRKFNRRDGMGIGLLRQAGIKTAVLSSIDSLITRHFCEMFGVDYILLGVNDKWHEIEKLQIRCGLALEEIAYVSDDIDEYQVLQRVGMPITVADGMAANKAISTYVTTCNGGEGAVREAIEVILAGKRA